MAAHVLPPLRIILVDLQVQPVNQHLQGPDKAPTAPVCSSYQDRPPPCDQYT